MAARKKSRRDPRLQLLEGKRVAYVEHEVHKAAGGITSSDVRRIVFTDGFELVLAAEADRVTCVVLTPAPREVQ
jgi:hypothetical protein